jgi:hypothetical protein
VSTLKGGSIVNVKTKELENTMSETQGQSAVGDENNRRPEETAETYRGTIESWTETALWDPCGEKDVLGWMPGSIRLEVLLTHRKRPHEPGEDPLAKPGEDPLAEPIRATVDLVFSAGPQAAFDGKTAGVRAEPEHVKYLYWATGTGHLVGAEVELTMLGKSWDFLRLLWDWRTVETIRREAEGLSVKAKERKQQQWALAETVTKDEMEAQIVALALARKTKSFNSQREVWEALAKTEWARERGMWRWPYLVRYRAAKLGAWPSMYIDVGRRWKVPADLLEKYKDGGGPAEK